MPRISTAMAHGFTSTMAAARLPGCPVGLAKKRLSPPASLHSRSISGIWVAGSRAHGLCGKGKFSAMIAHMTTSTTQHLRITGRVQSVGYRWHMACQARALGLTGWVRNRQDGSVEALASGPVDAVQALVSWAHRGPELARVDAVVVCTPDAAEPYLGFEQRETV